MPTPAARAPSKRDTLNLRISPVERMLIDRAAEITGKTRTDFVLDAARRAAEEAVLERTLFVVSPDGYAEFSRLLDAPPKADARLQRLMRSTPPWDQE